MADEQMNPPPTLAHLTRRTAYHNRLIYEREQQLVATMKRLGLDRSQQLTLMNGFAEVAEAIYMVSWANSVAFGRVRYGDERAVGEIVQGFAR